MSEIETQAQVQAEAKKSTEWAMRCPECGSPNLPEKVLGEHSMVAFYRCEKCSHDWQASAYVTCNFPREGWHPYFTSRPDRP